MRSPFRQLEPPPGGLVRLRAGLEAQRRRVVRRRVAGMILAALVCVLGGVWLLRGAPSTPRVAPRQPAINWAALHPAASLAEASTHAGASVQVASTSLVGVVHVTREQKVTYYRVSALPASHRSAP